MTKTWFDLLGSDTKNCEVDENSIIRRESGGQCRILWTFDTKKQAKAALEEWKSQVLIGALFALHNSQWDD